MQILRGQKQQFQYYIKNVVNVNDDMCQCIVFNIFHVCRWLNRIVN